MRNYSYENKTQASYTTHTIVDAVCIHDRYVDTRTIKKKAAGIISFSIIACVVVAFSFIVFFI